MAQLHYNNLPVHRPDILMGMSVSGLKIFYDFLTRAKKHMDAASLRLAWHRGSPPHDVENDEAIEGCWIQLAEPEDRPNEPDSTFRSFLDENVGEIYEWKPTGGQHNPVQGPIDRTGFKPETRIRVLDRHPETQQLLLERAPSESAQLRLRPNTYPIECQRRALRSLQNEPQRSHLPLLRLFESLDHARWDNVTRAEIGESDWTVLTDKSRPGTEGQRRFVKMALGTPDFAFLEGPPGSGKTTAICELILQLAKRGKRTLLSASTHVAVDNVLERLMDKGNSSRDLMIPVRIGDRRNVSEKARPWQMEEFIRTERDRILRGLDGAEPLTSSQESLRELLQQGSDVIERMVLDAANLVCGTTIGILQHPDIRGRRRKHRGADPDFDVLIVDEASKTPFQEFLVPALWAKRWIIVGDPKQLSPYVDDEALAVNIETCLPDGDIRDACVDAFMAARRRHPRVVAVATDTKTTKRAYDAQCAARGIEVADADQADEGRLRTASIVVGGKDSLRRNVSALPLDLATIRGADGELPLLRRRADAWLRLSGQDREEQPEWAREIGWRLARAYEQRFTEKIGEDTAVETTAKRLEKEIDALLPVREIVEDEQRIRQDIDRVRRVALPSVLESLQHGFERNRRQRRGTALSDGMPEREFEQRHVLLDTQHRMHPEIAEFPHVHIYRKDALKTPDYIEKERRWNYGRYAYRSIWIDVPATGAFRNNRNKEEARRITEELRHFDKWAATHRRGGESPWEVAVLAFYRGQEREIRNHLRRWTRSNAAIRYFRRGSRERPYLTVELCTVDRFQGHEADLVLISFANRRPTSFLESPNRLNVALTRARYQRVAIGDRRAMRRARDGALREFAKDERWEQELEGIDR